MDKQKKIMVLIFLLVSIALVRILLMEIINPAAPEEIQIEKKSLLFLCKYITQFLFFSVVSVAFTSVDF